MSWRVLLARCRIPLLVGGIGLLVVAWLLDLPSLPVLAGFAVVYWVALRTGTVRCAPIRISCPVAGRWVAVNSPADRIPSHGIQVYGQSHAIDLVHEPPGPVRPKFGWWPVARRPTEFPAFGQPVHAPADGTVVRVHSRERDHWSRNSWLALVYTLIIEASLRELTGPGRVLGNHVVIELDHGAYAVLAHLRRRSTVVTRGQRVRAGEPIAECGNSGNTTEPHLHLQVMDHPNVLLAAGLPMRFDYEIDGATHTGLPLGEQPFEVRTAAAGGDLSGR